MLKKRIKNIISAMVLGILITFSIANIKVSAMTGMKQSVQSNFLCENIEDLININCEDTYFDFINEMLDASYIDKSKANEFIKGINSEDVQLEISKAYNLFIIDSFVKSGKYSKERGELEKQLVEINYLEDPILYEEIYDKYLYLIGGVKIDIIDNVDEGFYLKNNIEI